MSLASTRTVLEAALTDFLGTYRDISVNPPAEVGPAFWLGANVPEQYRVDTLEAILQFAGFESFDKEWEDTAVHGRAFYRLTLIQHGSGLSVEEPLYAVLLAFPDADPGGLVPESDITLESVTVTIPEQVRREA